MKKELGRHELEFVQTVQAHIKNLKSLCDYNTNAPTIRISTGTLRALLSEDMLQRAWYLSGLKGPMTFKTYAIASIDGDDAVAYCGGGDVIPGAPFSACHNATLKECSLNLRDFCRQPRIQVRTEIASTVDIIKYVANALGVTHFDPNGKTALKFDLLRRIEAGDAGQLFIGLVNDRNMLHHEILSIAQAVVRSPQVHELLEWHQQE
jgi:hypothetical protein